ncbi:MAG: hypothetical protein ACC645_19875 [Pirellulales bacterium]
MSRDPTERRPTRTWLAVRRRPKSVGAALLFSSALLITLAYTAIRYGSAPDVELLISSEPSNVLWDYDPTQAALHAQADGRVQRVFCNGKEIELLANLAADATTGGTDITGSYGTFLQDGAAKFYETHVIDESTPK